MPKPYCYFESIEEYLSQGGGLRSRNLIQTEREVLEAVANFIRSRGTVKAGVKD